MSGIRREGDARRTLHVDRSIGIELSLYLLVEWIDARYLAIEARITDAVDAVHSSEIDTMTDSAVERNNGNLIFEEKCVVNVSERVLVK